MQMVFEGMSVANPHPDGVTPPGGSLISSVDVDTGMTCRAYLPFEPEVLYGNVKWL